MSSERRADRLGAAGARGARASRTNSAPAGIERRQLELDRKRKTLEAQIAALRLEFDAEETETLKIIGQEQAQEAQLVQERMNMGQSRKRMRN